MAATVAPFRGRGEMPRPKVAMRRIKEVLRLKEGRGLSDTTVSRSVRIARSTVKEYLDCETASNRDPESLELFLYAGDRTRFPPAANHVRTGPPPIKPSPETTGAPVLIGRPSSMLVRTA